MHSSGDVGAQFRHSRSSDFSIVVRSRFSPLWVGWRTLPICLFSFLACVRAWKGVRGWCNVVCMLGSPNDTRHNLWQTSYLNKLSHKSKHIQGKKRGKTQHDLTMRSRSENSPTSRQSNHGTQNSPKTRLQRKTNRQPSRPLTIRSQPLCRQRERTQPRIHRKHPRGPHLNRWDGCITDKRTRWQNQGTRTLLQNLHRHPGERLNVPQMPARNARRMGRKVLLLPLKRRLS